jgi:MFS family permease
MVREAKRRGGLSYENTLMLILGLTVGCVTIDRLSINFLAPYIVRDLHLTNFTLGLLSSVLAIAWATSGYVLGRAVDRSGQRKWFLFGAVVLFSLCSSLSAFATSFATLALARVVMGLAEGPVIPVGQSMMALASSERRRGFNMGFTQNFCAAVLASFLGPVILTSIAEAHGWRAAFFVTGIPGLIMALLIARFLKPGSGAPAATAVAPGAPEASIGAGTRSRRNIWLCALLATAIGGWLFIQNAFLPLYLVEVVGVTPTQMGLLMSVVGAGAVVGSFFLPLASDHIGRRAAMVIASALGVIAPLATLYMHQSLGVLAVLLFVGWLANGCFPIYMSTIPAETVPISRIAGTTGLVMGAGEIFGGTLAPPLAGWAADLFGLSVVFLAAATLAVLALVISLCLEETAPRVRLRHAARRMATADQTI